MGGGSFDPAKYAAYTTTTRGKSTAEVYASRGLDKNLNPHGVKVRESRDSTDNPTSTPVIIGLDVTGSMGMIADVIARQGLGILFNELFDTKPISNPHVMFMGIGDANCDQAPLQVSQFEADNRVVEQLTQMWLEHGGGGNNFESYNLAWYFAARHTVHDAFEKRARRGYLFTVGDEEAPDDLTTDQIARVIGDTLQVPLTSRQMLDEAMRIYDVFHIMIGEGNYAKGHPDKVRTSWTEMLGQRALWLTDHTKLAETIIGAIEMAEGVETAKASRFGDAVESAVRGITPGRRPLLPA
jgi:hypothetical protein